MKTIKELLKELPEWIQGLVLKYFMEDDLEYEYEDLQTFLRQSFYWEATTEGYDFWNAVQENNLKKAESIYKSLTPTP